MDTPNTQPAGQQQGLGLSKKQQRRLAKQQAKRTQHAGQMVKSSRSRIIFWLVILALIGFFVYAIAQLAGNAPDTDGLPTDIAITADDNVLGNPDSKVQLIEYADFQCPGCGAFHPLVKQIMAEYEDTVAYAYRHFPLPQHQHANLMARASEAAANQGKFWQMHDLIFENQKKWSILSNVDATISGFATQLKLDSAQFEIDIDSRETKDAVETDHEGGIGYGANSTPTFFLNGIKIQLPRSLDEFKAVLDEAIQKADTVKPAAETL